jgi:hypothetical protein
MNIQGLNVPHRKCPACGYEIDSATCVDGSDTQPKMGDFTICINCMQALKFGYYLRLELLSGEDVDYFKKAIRETYGK